MAYGGDKRQIAHYLDAIWAANFTQTPDHFLLMPVELLIGNDDGQRIDAGRQMLKGNAQLFKHRQNPAAKAKLRVHLVLFQMDDGKAFFAGNAGNASVVVLRLRQNHGAGVLWIVGIFHIDGNPAFLHRKNAVLMQYGGAHIGKLPQFAVRDLGDGAGVGDDAGIRHQKP